LAVECLDRVLGSEWLKERSKADRDLLRLTSTKRSHDRLVDKTSVTIDANCPRGGRIDEVAFDTCLNPLDAIQFLSTLFAVIVEDEWYDGSFLLWMARMLGFNHLITAYRNGRFVFRHAGGKSGMARSALILSYGVWPRKDSADARAFKLWACAVLDNDAKYPGHTPNTNILADLKPYVVFVHQLRRRSIENYLPLAALQRFDKSAAFKRKVDAFFRLSAVQRQHFHMKEGFRFKDQLAPAKHTYLAASSPFVEGGAKRLYSTVADDDWGELAAGFGGALSTIYVDEEHRPRPSDSTGIDAADKRELQELLESIYQRFWFPGENCGWFGVI
jgi:hypothetical protein